MRRNACAYRQRDFRQTGTKRKRQPIKQIISVVLLGLTLTGCRLMGWYPCDSLSGWCKPKKPAAIDS
ncbi:hypothetical protein A6J88_03745 [Neisseria mucosa]|uniref:Lipoprotein n=1 Tax=Neisseria mucosa TaxID=488 RepID=A0ABM6JAH2_NEIMU|nr:hypothetical protein A6J88_03745 [Neisseria mucosa]